MTASILLDFQGTLYDVFAVPGSSKELHEDLESFLGPYGFGRRPINDLTPFLLKNDLAYLYPKLSSIFERYELESLEKGTCRWLPGAPDLLYQLHRRGIPHAIVSSNSRVLIGKVIESFGWDIPVFGRSSCLGDLKPSPNSLYWAQDFLDCSTGWYVGDSVCDAEAALECGMTPVMVGDTRLPQGIENKSMRVSQVWDVLSLMKDEEWLTQAF